MSELRKELSGNRREREGILLEKEEVRIGIVWLGVKIGTMLRVVRERDTLAIPIGEGKGKESIEGLGGVRNLEGLEKTTMRKSLGEKERSIMKKILGGIGERIGEKKSLEGNKVLEG